MNCPVCARRLAPTLTICPSCGAMVYDTVREELQTKITPGTPRLRMTIETVTSESKPTVEPPKTKPPEIKAPEIKLPIARPARTAGLSSPKTSPTLIEFQNRNASLPDWRLQLQNAVQLRKGAQNTVGDTSNTSAQFLVNGGAALKAEIVGRT